MKFEFGLEAIIAALIIIPASGYFLNKKYSIYLTWISLIKKYAPLWLIFFPAIITYLFVCGAFSALGASAYALWRGKEGFDEHEFSLLENSIEWMCSLVMPFLYFRILRRNNFPAFWLFIITIVHMIVAGYRDPKLLYLAGGRIQSGPVILQQPDFLDAMFPLISLVIYLASVRMKAFNFSRVPAQ